MRLTLITAAIMLVSVQANASIEQQLTQCAATADKLDRLICYDKLAESVKGMTPDTISTQAIPATVATVAKILLNLNLLINFILLSIYI